MIGSLALGAAAAAAPLAPAGHRRHAVALPSATAATASATAVAVAAPALRPHFRTRHSPRLASPVLPLLVLLLSSSSTIAGAAAAAAAGGDASRLSGCPSWISDYIAFHRTHRLAPGAKYLLHTCTSPPCGGVGDRLRGALWSARVAVATRRVLLLLWTHPTALTHYLQPADIDWRSQDVPIDEMMMDVMRVDRVRWLDAALPGSGLPEFVSNQSVLWQLENNMAEDYEAVEGAPELGMWSDAAACLYQALFKPTDFISDAVDEQLTALYGNPHVPYSATHIRIGGMEGEGGSVIGLGRMDKLSYVLESIVCLRSISAGMADGGADLPRPPQLIVSDSNGLRLRVKEGQLRGLTAPGFTASHLDKVRVDDVQLHATTFVALGLLARARCAVYTDSGFSRMAFYWGRRRQEGCVAVMPRHNGSLLLFERLWERWEERLAHQGTAAGSEVKEEEEEVALPPRVCDTHPGEQLEGEQLLQLHDLERSLQAGKRLRGG